MRGLSALVAGHRYKLWIIAALWLVFTAIFTYALAYQWHSCWRAFRVPDMRESFWDMKATILGLDELKQGRDPLVTTHSYDHPRIWLWIFDRFNIQKNDAVPIAVGAAALFMVCLSVLIWRARSPLEALLIFSTGFSSAALLGLQRGNTDIIIFSMIFAGVMADRSFIFASFLSLAALLKLFPFFGLWAGLVIPRYRLFTIIALIVLTAFFVVNLDDLIKIKNHVSVFYRLSYGMLFIKTFISRYLPHSMELYYTSWAIVVLIMGGGLHVASKTSLQPESPNKTESLAFLTFGSIFLVTFLISSSWYYRLIFLIPLIPFLMRQQQLKKQAVRMVICILIPMHIYVIGTPQADIIGTVCEMGLVYYIVFFSCLLLKPLWLDTKKMAERIIA